jgi:hypothetical protein
MARVAHTPARAGHRAALSACRVVAGWRSAVYRRRSAVEDINGCAWSRRFADLSPSVRTLAGVCPIVISDGMDAMDNTGPARGETGGAAGAVVPGDTLRVSHACVCFVIIIGRLRHNPLPTDPRHSGEFPYRTKNLGFTFYHKIWPLMQIITEGLPKSRALFCAKMWAPCQFFRFSWSLLCGEAQYAERLNSLLLDLTPTHVAQRVPVPENVVLLWCPPYGPDLNPVEVLWEVSSTGATSWIAKCAHVWGPCSTTLRHRTTLHCGDPRVAHEVPVYGGSSRFILI